MITILNEGQRVFRVNEFCKRHGLAIGGVRHWIFYANDNGFNKVIRRIGRAVYIIEDEFLKWLDEMNGKPIKVRDKKQKTTTNNVEEIL